MASKLRRLFPSLESLEQQVVDRSERTPANSGTFGHPTARKLFIVMGVVTVVAHVAAAVYLMISGH
ncbi:hypothetical protein ACQEU3_32255 [Spirillospora sp. CA-253888]